MIKEISIEEQAETLAKESGDSLSKFFEVVRRELSEIQFKGIEFVRMHIEFEVNPNPMRDNLIVCKIWTSALSSASVNEDSRYFHQPHNMNDMATIFWLILHWRSDLIRDHQKLLKQKSPKTLFDVN